MSTPNTPQKLSQSQKAEAIRELLRNLLRATRLSEFEISVLGDLCDELNGKRGWMGVMPLADFFAASQNPAISACGNDIKALVRSK
jgi:hypothetical protein